MSNLDCEDSQFQKLFEFERSHDWRLPKTVYSGPHFEIQELQDMKRELNLVKGQLNQFDLSEWSLHTQNRDVAGYVIGQLRRRIRPELLTQAWCKFFEIVNVFPIVKPKAQNCFRSVHLCEAPGAFICALNHYMVLHYPKINWQWQANTLNPDYEGNPVSHMISDDRLICHTYNNWLFGIDLTGDIQKHYNHVDIVSQTTFEKKVDLVTADGSIDCMSDPGEQEKLVEFLHYCETMTALAVLAEGGSFVLKIFTIFEESTVCLLYLLNCIFNKTFLFKPCTSKSGNSELYLVCIGYNGFNVLSSIWDTLMGPYKNGFFDKNVSMFLLDEIPHSFKIQLKSCCSDFFLEKQIITIKNNIYYYLHPDKDNEQYLHHRKIDVAQYYIKKYKLKGIPKNCKVVSYLKVRVRESYLANHNHFESQSICLKDWCLDKFVNISLGKKIDIVHTSKFASINCFKKLVKYLGNSNQSLPPLYNSVLNILNKTVTVIDIKSFNVIPHYKYQKDLFFMIKDAIKSEKHIYFLNVPLLTHFLAAIWCIIASSFEKVYYGGGWFLFYKPVPANIDLANNMLSLIENAYNNIPRSVFPCDIMHIFQPNIFYNELSLVPQILSVYNNFLIPTERVRIYKMF